MKLSHAIVALLLLAPAVRVQGDVTRMPAGRCATEQQVWQLVQQALDKADIHDTQALSPEDCSYSPSIPEGTQLDVEKIHWDSVLHSFEVRLRCRSTSACLPFLVRVRPRAGAPLSLAAPGIQKPTGGTSPAMVKPGQLVTLFWEKKGLRISRIVVCLDRGKAGEPVRTRTRDGGRIVRARVVSPGVVEAGL